MDISPLQQTDGVHAGSALESLAHRLVAVHQRKVPETRVGRVVEDIVDIPIFSEAEFGLDDPVQVSSLSFLDRVRRFFTG